MCGNYFSGFISQVKNIVFIADYFDNFRLSPICINVLRLQVNNLTDGEFSGEITTAFVGVSSLSDKVVIYKTAFINTAVGKREFTFAITEIIEKLPDINLSVFVSICALSLFSAVNKIAFVNIAI